ncbi:MAG: hypothetical protein M0R39_15300 [Prolixibacteraceae bacterium]|nr:hypothetical protein [Prolixibacteraceae bacterium]
MHLPKWFIKLYSGKHANTTPLLIIKQETKEVNVKEYQTIEEAIADLENDPNVPSEKIENLKSSLKKLKNKTTIRIRNGEILL